MGLLAAVGGPLMASSVWAGGLPFWMRLPILLLSLGIGGSFALLAGQWFLEALSAGPRLVMDDEGLRDRLLPAPVCWSDLRAAFELRKEGKPFLFLELADPAGYMARVPRWRRSLPPFTAGPFQGRYLVVLLAGLDVDPAVLEAEIRTRIMLAGGGPPPPALPAPKGTPESGAQEDEATRDEVDELGGTTF